MKYLSLFSGIGGFELGIQQAHVEITNRTKNRGGKGDSSEDDAKGQRLVTKKGKATPGQRRWNGELPDWEHDQGAPTCVGYSEIDKYATAIYQNHFPNHKNYGDITKINEKELPDFDLLVGGFPCQPFSIAGRRGGFLDTRGTLFFEIARIIKQKQPRFLLLENVKGLLSHSNGLTFYTIIATLDELGYDLQWQVLNSKDFGVPQNRERVFIVGHLRGTPRPQVFPIGETNKETNGNSIRQLNKPTHSNDRIYSEKGISPTLNTAQGGLRQPKIVGGLQGHQSPREDGISPTLTTAMGQGGGQTPIVWSEDIKIRRLTPLECERLQGFPDRWTEGVSDSQRYKCLGNAVTVNVIQAIIEKLLSPGI